MPISAWIDKIRIDLQDYNCKFNATSILDKTEIEITARPDETDMGGSKVFLVMKNVDLHDMIKAINRNFKRRNK